MRRVRTFVVWWVPCTGLWLLFIPSITWPEGVAATGAGAVSAAIAVVAAWAARIDYRFRPGWLRWAAPVPKELARDTAWVAVLVARRVRGRDVVGSFRRIRLPAAADEAERAARNAWVTAALSVTPGTFVVRIDEDEALLHEIAPGTGSADRVDAAAGAR